MSESGLRSPAAHPTVEEIAYAIWDLVDQVPGETILNALAAVSGGVIVNISDRNMEAQDIAIKFGNAVYAATKKNWEARMKAESDG